MTTDEILEHYKTLDEDEAMQMLGRLHEENIEAYFACLHYEMELVEPPSARAEQTSAEKKRPQ